MAFCACLGSTLQSTGTVQGCCPLAVAKNQAFPGGPWCWVLLELLLSSPPRAGSGLSPQSPSMEWLMHFSTFLSKVAPMHLPAVSFSHLSAVMGAPSGVGVAVVSQSRSDLTCAQVQHFPFPFLARSWQLPKPIL